MCWRIATGPQCLRVETISEVHLFPYGYFQHAKFFRSRNRDVIEMRFQETTVIAIGKNLEPLCDALARLTIERIKTRPAHHDCNAKESIITEIEIRENKALERKPET